MTFNVLAEEKSNAIEIQTPKDLKKYKKKLRIEKKKCKNKEKIRNIEQAIEDYEAKKCGPKVIQKPVKTKPSKSNESEQMLEKEFQKNKKFHQKNDDFEKSVKEERRRRHEEFLEKKEFDRKIAVAKKRAVRRYIKLFTKWQECRKRIKKIYSTIFSQWKFLMNLKKHIQGKNNQQKKIIFEKWKKSFIRKAKINAMSIKRFFNQWKNRKTCPVCLEMTACSSVFECGPAHRKHSMCNECADSWFKSENKYYTRIEQKFDPANSCPLCRKEIKKNDTIIKYNPQYINTEVSIIDILEEKFISGIKAIEFYEDSLYGCNMLQQNVIIIESNRELIDIYKSIRGEKGMRYAEYFIEEVVDTLDYRIEIKEFIVDHFRFKLYPSVMPYLRRMSRGASTLVHLPNDWHKFGKLPDDWRNKCNILNNYEHNKHGPDEWNCSKCGERCNSSNDDSKCTRCNTKIPDVSKLFGSEWICCNKCYGPHIQTCKEFCNNKKPEYEHRPFFSINRYMRKKNGESNYFYSPLTADRNVSKYHFEHINNPSFY